MKKSGGKIFVDTLIEHGEVDLAFVCTSAYVAGHDHFGMELLAAPEVDGQQVYYSVLIVPADSPAQEMIDLQGKVFAFTDPMSHSGRVYPTYLLQQLGTTPEEFFSRTFFTYSHDKAIEAVTESDKSGCKNIRRDIFSQILSQKHESVPRTREVTCICFSRRRR